jgi:hypothetical protein
VGIWSKLRGLVSGSGGGAPPGEPSAEELFSAEVAAAMRALPAVASVAERPQQFALGVGMSDGETTVFLGNIFSETRDLPPSERAARIAHFVGAFGERQTRDLDWDEARPRLMPLLRSSTLYASVPQTEKTRPLRRPFAPFLIECLAVDSDRSYITVNARMTAGWGADDAAVFAAARENAARSFVDEDVRIYDPDAPFPLWHVAKNDSYESSRLLIPGWLASFSGKVSGRPVAIVPHRSLVLVGGDGDPACLARLGQTACREYEASTRRISPALYTVGGAGAVVPLVLPGDHPLANDVALGHASLATAEYAAQKEHLQAQVGDDLFVASHVAVQGQDGGVFSCCTWTRGISSLLPVADQVALVIDPSDESGPVFRVPWGVVVARAGACLAREEGIDPPRFRTTGWPAPAVIDELRAARLR